MISITAFAIPNLYEYHVNDYPTTKAACSEQAEAIAGRLAVQTGVTVLQSYCKREQYSENYEIVVIYEAKQKLLLVTNYDKYAFPSQAFYYSREACELALPDEVQAYQIHTGLDYQVRMAGQTSRRLEHNTRIPFRLKVSA